MDLTQQLAAADRLVVQQALADYQMIARRFDRVRAGDGERIRQCCEILGATMSDVQSNFEAYQSMPALVEHAAQVESKKLVAKDMGQKVLLKRREVKDTAKRLDLELRELGHRLREVNHEAGRAKDAAKRIPTIRDQHWRVFGTKPTIEGRLAGRDGVYPRAHVQAWLADEPQRVVFPHKGDPGTVEILRARGYKPTTAGVWSRVTENGELEQVKPVKKKKPPKKQATVKGALERRERKRVASEAAAVAAAVEVGKAV